MIDEVLVIFIFSNAKKFRQKLCAK